MSLVKQIIRNKKRLYPNKITKLLNKLRKNSLNLYTIKIITKNKIAKCQKMKRRTMMMKKKVLNPKSQKLHQSKTNKTMMPINSK